LIWGIPLETKKGTKGFVYSRRLLSDTSRKGEGFFAFKKRKGNELGKREAYWKPLSTRGGVHFGRGCQEMKSQKRKVWPKMIFSKKRRDRRKGKDNSVPNWGEEKKNFPPQKGAFGPVSKSPFTWGSGKKGK